MELFDKVERQSPTKNGLINQPDEIVEEARTGSEKTQMKRRASIVINQRDIRDQIKLGIAPEEFIKICNSKRFINPQFNMSISVKKKTKKSDKGLCSLLIRCRCKEICKQLTHYLNCEALFSLIIINH